MRWWFPLLWTAAVACDHTTNLASRRQVDAGVEGDGDSEVEVEPTPDANVERDASVPDTDAAVVSCNGKPCACSNHKDDDGDGLIDGFDPECTGPYDQDEASFATGESKNGGNPKCEDCFFDGNAGSGDDGCRIAVSCILGNGSSGAPGACNSCSPTAQCINNCLPRTPNGCDCFGCCDLTYQDVEYKIRLVDTCSIEQLPNAQSCPRCAITMDCYNSCERCELCAGKTEADLPADCASSSGPDYSCNGGKVCGPDFGCSSVEYCIQGCCVPIEIP